MAHKHSVYDNDGYFVLDPKNKTFKNESEKDSIVQFDHNSEEIRFKFPKIIEGHDMSKVDLIQVHFDNTSTGTSASLRTTNAAPVNITSTLEACEDDQEYMRCSWLVGEESTQLAGSLKFKLKFVCYGNDNTPAYKMNTLYYDKYQVLASSDSSDSSEGFIDIYQDILLDIERRLTEAENKTISQEQIANAVSEYFEENPVKKDKELQLYSYATRVQNAQSMSTLTLALMADTHYCDQDNNAQDKLETANTMSLFSHYANVDAIVNLGDMVRGDETKDKTVGDLTALIENTKENANCPVYFVRGNHDDNGWYSYEGDGTNQPDELINDAEWCQLVGNTFVTDENKPNGGYGYFDHEKSKIRVFLLNTSDIPYITEDDGSYRYNSYQHSAFSNEQLNFVANALKFEGKESPNEWAAMFLMHIPLDTTKTSGYRFGGKDVIVRGLTELLSIITAYRKGVSYSFSGSVNNASLGELAEDFTVSVDVDYSTKGVGDVICFVNGHTHIDNCSQKVGYENSLSYGYTYLGVMGSTAFATMVVDRENSIVTTFKYGDVTTLSDMAGRTDYEGTIDGETEFDIDMSTGTWIIPFDQFRPTGENLYNGLSDLWGDGYALDNAASLNTETLELTNATEGYSSIALSKGVVVKGSTQYILPSEFVNGTVVAFTTRGEKITTLKPVESDGCQVITTTASTRYLVFRFHKPSYLNYENFYIREAVAETPDEPVEEYVTKEEFTNTIGDINTALENIIEIQENLIGGVTE